MTSLHDRLLRRIRALANDAVELLVELIAVDSSSPSFPGIARQDVLGGETRCNEMLRERFEQAGLQTHWVAPDPDRKNLVGVRKGAGTGRSLLMNGHIDTVPPVDPENWRTGSPWTAGIFDSVITGLGSADMKGALVAMWLATQAIADERIDLAGDLQLHSVIGEEMMEHQLGTSACIAAGFTADAAIVTEPSSATQPLMVCPVAPGYLDLRVDIKGKSAHVGNRALALRPGDLGTAIGVNAVEKGMIVLRHLQQIETSWVQSKTHPWFTPGFFSITPGVFHSDAGFPMPLYFADHARILCAVWYPPDESAALIAEEIATAIGVATQEDGWLAQNEPDFTVLSDWPAFQTAWDEPIVELLLRARNTSVESSDIGADPQIAPVHFGAACDASFLSRAGIPTVIFGPGNLRHAHARDEALNVNELLVAAHALSIAAAEWCGVSGSGREE